MEAILNREIIINKTLCRMLGVAMFVVFISLGAFVRVPLPFTPVPLTLQTFFVLLGPALMGRRLGITAQLSYIALGVLGVPVFTGAGSGFLYLFGPTGGYLMGFILASMFIGYFIGFGKNRISLILGVFIIADLILLSCGAIWLKTIFKLSFKDSFSMGFLPFLSGDLLKIMAVTALYLRLNGRASKIFS
jgi:biotin transport system substrate-specific component